jgi:hypothetical protein
LAICLIGFDLGPALIIGAAQCISSWEKSGVIQIDPNQIKSNQIPHFRIQIKSNWGLDLIRFICLQAWYSALGYCSSDNHAKPVHQR